MSNFQIAAGSTFAATTMVKQGGLPFDLTGCRVLFVAKSNPSDPDGSAVALLDNQGLGGVTVPAPTTGRAFINMAASSTYGLTVPQLYYEIWIHDTSGLEWRSEFGQIQLLARILVQQP